MRDFWKGENEMLAEFANRFTGSSDLYLNNWRTPTASINFITAHDGFTMRDLVSYNEKHNEANGEENNDGENNNRSSNYGIEGHTNDPEILKTRQKQVKNFLTTLFLSQGVPMLVAGDELGRTQHGNNNAYCQDNEISWINWPEMDEDLFSFTSRLIHFRLEHPVFCRKKWFQYKPIKGRGVTDIEWFLPEGYPMSDDHWNTTFAKSLSVYLSGYGLDSTTEQGERIVDDTFLILINSDDKEVVFTIPDENWGKIWFKILDTADNFFDPDNREFKLSPSENIIVQGMSFVLLIQEKS